MLNRLKNPNTFTTLAMNPRRDNLQHVHVGGDDPDPESDEAKAAAAEEKKFEERFNKFFHKASKGREERFKKDLMKDIDTSLGSKLEEFGTKFMSQKKPDDEHEGGGNADPSRQKDGKFLSKEQAAELSQARKDAAEAKALAEKHKKEADDERMRAARNEERQALSSALMGRVKPILQDTVVEQLHKNIVRDPESKAILWKGEDGEVVPYKDGIEAWSKTDFAKEVAPPREVGGAGGRGPDGGRGKGPITSADVGDMIFGVK